MQPIYFLSDLHLPADESPLRDCFLQFVAGAAREAQAVYVLGDLFEFWAGDDYGLDHYYEETSALRSLYQAGVEVYFQHGNRDFLVGQQFADLAELTLLPEEHTLQLGGQKVLLAHGDQYCTDDRSYQRWRAFSRNPEIQFLFNCLPRGWRESIAGSVRGHSSREVANKPEAITDVNDDAIRATFARTKAERIIHGHTHRPADHPYPTNGQSRLRTVLADWRPGYCEVLRFDQDGYCRVPLSLSSSD